ncbi:Arc family DNA-binding protein [Entomomonas moraniae]|uniref:Arc family DNA-binding protein n=1 Tax=Entomomonas moraniae TaxID=2213226 RepID=A0A3S9XA82_9GAMM|nr:Arc family DNA-binding protein [Entomomonas moraniae]AZS49345.1 Arc family DNA-binding protein [Entomomonas moraniae]
MKKDDIYRSQFRLPYSLYEKLKESADANNRSVNAELIIRLENSFLFGGMEASNNKEEATLTAKEIFRISEDTKKILGLLKKAEVTRIDIINKKKDDE